MNPNYNVIPCFVEKQISKQHFKYVLYQNKICGFLPQVPLAPPIIPKKKTPYFIFFSSSFVFQNSPFWTIKNHIIMIQNNKNSKFKLTKFFDESLS